MNIVIFISSLDGGGAERVAANLANHWAVKGWTVAIITLAQSSIDFYELHPTVKRISLGLAGDSDNVLIGFRENIRRVIALRRVLSDVQPDIALGMMTDANVLLAMATCGMPTVRSIGSEHIYPPQVSLGILWEWLRRLSYGRLAAVTALTHESAEWIKAHTNARQVPVIPNAAPWPLLSQTPRISPNSLGAFPRHLLLAVGRLDTQKGFDKLLNAFADLVQDHPEWGLVILGEGPLRTGIERQVRTAGLGKRVFLPGRVGNVGEWYERADLYVMSSLFEGFPNTLAEALAHGLPAVSFDCDTGPRDIIRHEVDGLLVPAGDVSQLTAALDRVMRDAVLRARFAERAVDARERFSIERIANMWEKLFEGAGT